MPHLRLRVPRTAAVDHLAGCGPAGSDFVAVDFLNQAGYPSYSFLSLALPMTSEKASTKVEMRLDRTHEFKMKLSHFGTSNFCLDQELNRDIRSPFGKLKRLACF